MSREIERLNELLKERGLEVYELRALLREVRKTCYMSPALAERIAAALESQP